MADVYGGENDITSFRQIYRGEIGPVMVLSSTDTIAIAVAVWGDTTTYTSGEKGGDVKLIKTLTLDKA